MATMKIKRTLSPWAKEYIDRKELYQFYSGGRFSGKSHHVAEEFLLGLVKYPDLRMLCTRQVQKSLDDSVKKLIEDKIEAMGLGLLFEVQKTCIKRIGGNGEIKFNGLQDHTVESIKSLEGYAWVWIEEAQTISRNAIDMLVPTIIRAKSLTDKPRFFYSWNPTNKDDAVEQECARRLREGDALHRHVNYNENTQLSEYALKEAELAKKESIKKYNHIYLGGFKDYADEPLFAYEMGRYIHAQGDKYKDVRIRIDTAQKGGKRNDAHGYVVVGYKQGDDRTYILDAGALKCGFADLIDGIVDIVEIVLFSGVCKIDGVVIEDANIGAATAETLDNLFYSKNKHVSVGLTQKYGNKFQRGMECVAYFNQGMVLFPHGEPPIKTRHSNLDLLEKEHATFTEDDSHASDDVLDPLLWEIVTEHGRNTRVTWL